MRYLMFNRAVNLNHLWSHRSVRKLVILPFCICSCIGISACAQTSSNACDGWRNLTPSSGTRSYIVANDRPFAEQVASHREFGRARGCWQ